MTTLFAGIAMCIMVNLVLVNLRMNSLSREMNDIVAVMSDHVRVQALLNKDMEEMHAEFEELKTLIYDPPPRKIDPWGQSPSLHD